jgi:hypothetical protein
LSRVFVTETGFGLVIGFINRSQVVTTINYNTITKFYFYKSLHASLLILFPFVFNIRFLTTDLYNTGTNFTLPMSLNTQSLS